jgi:hypothetical protein
MRWGCATTVDRCLAQGSSQPFVERQTPSQADVVRMNWKPAHTPWQAAKTAALDALEHVVIGNFVNHLGKH